MITYSRQQLLEVCRLVYDRNLTNAAGSNFSVPPQTTPFIDPYE